MLMSNEANNDDCSVVLFHTIHALFVLKKELDKRAIETNVVAVPRHISSDCGSALQFKTQQTDILMKTIQETEQDIAGIHVI